MKPDCYATRFRRTRIPVSLVLDNPAEDGIARMSAS
jgi:hypothetical protein